MNQWAVSDNIVRCNLSDFVNEGEETMKCVLSVAVDIYTVVQWENGKLEVHRHGQPWRDETGDNMILSLAQEIDHLRHEVEYLEHCHNHKITPAGLVSKSSKKGKEK